MRPLLIFLVLLVPSSAIGQEKTVHVKGYFRKDGTYVQPHDRRPPGQGHASEASPTIRPQPEPQTPNKTQSDNDATTGRAGPEPAERGSSGAVVFVIGLVVGIGVLVGRKMFGTKGATRYRRRPNQSANENPFA